jgi:hypothetical protein
MCIVAIKLGQIFVSGILPSRRFLIASKYQSQWKKTNKQILNKRRQNDGEWVTDCCVMPNEQLYY